MWTYILANFVSSVLIAQGIFLGWTVQVSFRMILQVVMVCCHFSSLVLIWMNLSAPLVTNKSSLKKIDSNVALEGINTKPPAVAPITDMGQCMISFEIIKVCRYKRGIQCMEQRTIAMLLVKIQDGNLSIYQYEHVFASDTHAQKRSICQIVGATFGNFRRLFYLDPKLIMWRKELTLRTVCSLGRNQSCFGLWPS